jgi:hypothetical protein
LPNGTVSSAFVNNAVLFGFIAAASLAYVLPICSKFSYFEIKFKVLWLSAKRD